ncbi:hypothetical protein B5F17_10450 [Butyricicoccus pullicaecorum]|uniref:Uncharacterized protein n=1 Tax=Butyricicoccus pullicaecorum TaxID=501571 RepID=A0A1Y4L840_9FIRM|nr:hypothetical protein [Butyricicoccus pullicaecorum]OUP52060.1 hypothetical protein B5F17_10450 [Butyricicoccus pullicaecorum]
MKRRIFVIVLLCILCGVAAEQNIPEYVKTGVRISELSTQEQILFLSEHGVEIPPRLDGPYRADMLHTVIMQIEEKPKTSFGMCSGTEMIEFGEAARRVINAYYGIDGGEYCA